MPSPAPMDLLHPPPPTSSYVPVGFRVSIERDETSEGSSSQRRSSLTRARQDLGGVDSSMARAIASDLAKLPAILPRFSARDDIDRPPSIAPSPQKSRVRFNRFCIMKRRSVISRQSGASYRTRYTNKNLFHHSSRANIYSKQLTDEGNICGVKFRNRDIRRITECET